jgi:hypothetical protein
MGFEQLRRKSRLVLRGEILFVGVFFKVVAEDTRQAGRMRWRVGYPS